VWVAAASSQGRAHMQEVDELDEGLALQDSRGRHLGRLGPRDGPHGTRRWTCRARRIRAGEEGIGPLRSDRYTVVKSIIISSSNNLITVSATIIGFIHSLALAFLVFTSTLP